MSINIMKVTKASGNYKKQVNPFSLSRKNSWLLWVCQFVNIGSLSAEIEAWMLALLTLCLCWQGLVMFGNFRSKNQTNIPHFLLVILAIGGCIIIAFNANNLGVLLSMVHLLVFAYTLKAFEIKKRKDFYQLFLIGLFLLASALIFKQDLGFSIVILLAIILNLVVLQQIFSPTKALLSSIKTITILLLQSSMLAIILFIVFPRLSPFWQVPNAKSAQTGLSDEVSPGDIANLALSSDLAFRVDFKGKDRPRYSDLYWRAMTLENFDGRKWTRVIETKKNTSTQPSFVPQNDRREYFL